jgi:hypothetical protein
MAVAEPGSAGRQTAVARGEAARRRVSELRQRRAELAAGIRSNAETAERARVHALESLERVRQAHRDAVARHLDAGAAYRRAAALHEQIALVARDRASEEHQDAAAMHRAAAEVHEAAARVEDEKLRSALNIHQEQRPGHPDVRSLKAGADHSDLNRAAASIDRLDDRLA